MRRNIVIVSMLVGSMLLGGCSGKGEPVELYRGASENGYADTVKLSGVKRNNYSGYFLGEGISLETALELSNDGLNSLCYGWTWELSGKKYNGEEIKLEEGESEELWGVEREVEKPEELEDAEENGSEGTGDTKGEPKESEAEGDEEQGTEPEAKTEGNEEAEGEPKEEEVETEIVVETSGTVEKLIDIVDRELVLKSGQVLTVVPNYIVPVVEESEEDGDTEGTGEESAEGSGEGEESKPAEEGSEKDNEEPEEVEPLVETVKAIVVTNYSKENRTVKSCVESGWFTLQVDNYVECFGMKPLESEEEIPSNEIFSRLSESLGNPSIIWEQPTDDASYVKGMVQMVYAYEFPEYTFLAGVVGDTINSMYYIPKSLWLESDEYVGMKALYRGSYIEVDKSELPEVEEVE